MDHNKIKKLLEEKLGYLRTWLDRFGKAQSAAPYVQKNYELTEWELKALTDLPDKARESLPNSIEAAVDRDYGFVKKAIPMMPNYDVFLVSNSTAVTSSGTSIMHDYISQTVNLGTPETIAYSEKYTSQYHQLQEAQNRPSEVRSLIGKLKKDEILQRFDRAEKAYLLLKAGTGDRTSVANDLRNLLYGIEGNLFEIARIEPRENMTWKIMADRLAKGGPGSTEHSVIVEQESVRSVLIENLSKVAKDREGDTFRDIESDWVNVLDHIYTVLSLVNV